MTIGIITDGSLVELLLYGWHKTVLLNTALKNNRDTNQFFKQKTEKTTVTQTSFFKHNTEKPLWHKLVFKTQNWKTTVTQTSFLNTALKNHSDTNQFF